MVVRLGVREVRGWWWQGGSRFFDDDSFVARGRRGVLGGVGQWLRAVAKIRPLSGAVVKGASLAR